MVYDDGLYRRPLRYPVPRPDPDGHDVASPSRDERETPPEHPADRDDLDD